MSTWTKQKLGDNIIIFNGKAIKAESVGKYPVYGSNGKIGYFSESLYENSIILGRVGAYCGSVMIENDKFWASDNTIVLKNSPKTDLKFLFYILDKLNLRQFAGGAAQPLITHALIRQIGILMPELSVQKNIASVLSAYDDLIENNEKRIKILEEMAERLYREWFVKFQFPGHEKVRLVDSGTEYGKIPEGWEVISLSDAVSINPATRLKTKENITHVSMECLSNTLSTIDHNKITKKNGGTGTKFINGDTLFARITPCLQNGKNAFVNFLDKDEIATGSTEFIVMRAKKLSSAYIYFMTRGADFRKSAEMTMVGASGRQRVQGAFFQSYVVIVPDHSLLAIFESHVKSNFSEIEQLRKANQNLSKTRDLLIPQLVTGRRELS